MLIRNLNEFIDYCKEHIIEDRTSDDYIEDVLFENSYIHVWKMTDDVVRLSMWADTNHKKYLMINDKNNLNLEDLICQVPMEITDNILKIGNAMGIYLGEMK